MGSPWSSVDLRPLTCSFTTTSINGVRMNLGGTVKLNKGGLLAIVAFAALIVVYWNSTGDSENEIIEKDNVVFLRDLLSAAVDAAERGGNEVRKIREEATLNMKSKGQTAEGVNDPVTDGDMLSHIEMYYSLKKAFPNVEIISEEHDTSKVDRSKVAAANIHVPEIEQASLSRDGPVPVNSVRIWIDPLDATKEYTEDLRQYVTTMVCVAVQGFPTIGVIHKPFENFTAWGWVGRGAANRIAIGKEKDKTDDGVATVIVSLSHSGKVEEAARSAFGDDVKIIKAAGAGYKTLEVIKGSADAYVHMTFIKKWDLCAGHAILHSLHGHMTTLEGDPITYGSRDDYKVEKGVLATLYSHDMYLEKLKHVKE